MWKITALFTSLILSVSTAFGASQYMPKRFNTVTSHDDVYPYRLNNAKPSSGNKSTSMSNNNSVAPMGKRGVSKRTTNARAATKTSPGTVSANTNSGRRVVQRTNTARAAGFNSRNNNVYNTYVSRPQKVAARTTNVRNVKTTSTTVTSSEKVSTQRCLADYRECMEMYCLREDTAYNRCYCSAKLAQIDSKYQNKIDNLIQQIVKLKYNAGVDSDEIKEYWNKTVSVYTGTNPWVNIENALNIEWADTQSRVQGQNAFNTGHEYCSQHLRGCYYMANSLRNAYKSEIARDCDSYEKSLQKIKEAAESVIEGYND